MSDAPTHRVAWARPRCPLCGEENDCAPARSGSLETPCWCRSVEVSRAALDALRPADRGQACLCRRCAQEGPPSSPSKGPLP